MSEATVTSWPSVPPQARAEPHPIVRVCATVAVASVAAAAALIGILHLIGRGTIDPLTRTISDYALLPGGEVLFAATGGCLLVCCLALATGLRSRGVRGSRSVRILIVVGCAGLLLVAVVPTDPPAAALTVTGFVHRYAAGLMFFALPPVARLVARELATLGDTDRVVRRLTTLSTVSWWCLGIFLLCHLPTVFPSLPGVGLLSGAHAVLGLSERLLFVVDLALLLTFASALRIRGRWSR